jgi:hypothetical protein
MTTPAKTLPQDLTGMVFGRLTVLAQHGLIKHIGTTWKCVCVCGNEKIVDRQSLKKGHVRSCGCLCRDHCKALAIKRRQGGIVDGKKTKAYGVWQALRDRCNNPNNPAYKNYGGRGITVCKEWNSFPQFLKDMGEPPSKRSIDRIDNNKGYFAVNCRWATKSEQERNKRPRTHCRKGHEYTPDNTRISRRGCRECIICAKAHALAWYYKNKERKAKETTNA